MLLIGNGGRKDPQVPYFGEIMTNLLPLKPNHRTAQRLREAREREKDRLIKQIGINHEDAPLYEEELRLLAYERSLGR